MKVSGNVRHRFLPRVSALLIWSIAGAALAQAPPIQCGETVADVIEFLGDADVYVFTVGAGETVAITVAGGTAPFTRWNLLRPAPDETVLLGNASGQREITIDQPGLYRIEVFQANNAGTGTYNVTLEAVSETFNGMSNGTAPLCQRG